MSYSTGIAKDRIVATTITELENQSHAPSGFTLYHMEPSKDFTPGEYAVVFYNSQMPVGGYFMTGLDSYFDFGVER